MNLNGWDFGTIAIVVFAMLAERLAPVIAADRVKGRTHAKELAALARTAEPASEPAGEGGEQ